MFGHNVTEHNPAPSPSGHPRLSGPPALNDIHQIFTSRHTRFIPLGTIVPGTSVCTALPYLLVLVTWWGRKGDLFS